MVEYNFVKDLIERSIKDHWDLNALSDYKGGTYTYGDVAKKIFYLHRLFQDYGINKGDKIALVGRNNSNWGIIYLATITYGAVIVPILPDFSASETHNILNHSDSQILFVGDMMWGKMNEAEIPNVKVIISIANFDPLVIKNKEAHKKFEESLGEIETLAQQLTPDKIQYTEVSNAELGVLSYTSGTTGFSKGVMLTMNSLAANIDYGRKNIGLVAGDSIVSFLPLAHAFGCAFEFLLPFTVGCHVTFLTKIPSPNIILEAFGKIKPRLVLTVPLIIEKIFKKQLKPKLSKPLMRILLNIPLVNLILYRTINKKLSEVFGGNFLEIVIGGAPLNPDIERFFKKIRFRYAVGYGMTECGPLISYAGWQVNRMSSCGKTINYLELKIDSKDPKEEGEILVRGENVMVGYYKNPEDTSRTLIDGWLHTGDVGIIDPKGFLFIKGRSKSMILGPSGQNIYPEEIEARLNNLPIVQESVVVEQKGRLVGLIFPDFELIERQGMKVEELEPVLETYRSEVNMNLPQYSQISKLIVHAQEFEKTPKQSIKRFKYQYSEN